MAKLDFPKFQKTLSAFDFTQLFVDVLGWNRASSDRDWQSGEAGDTAFRYRMVAELAGVAVLQVVAAAGWPDETQRLAIWRQIANRHYENLLIFTEQEKDASQSLWYWVKRSKDAVTNKPKLTPRRHEYFRGQPVDLFASKLQAMVVELSELDVTGRIPVLEVARRMESALDVEKTTKKFYKSYQEQHDQLLDAIEGIDDERDRRWYASVILNRLMFVWFLQKKGFLNQADYDYLPNQLAASRARGTNRFFGEFLAALFFDAFAKPVDDRSAAVRTLTGEIPYLNGGLFLHHKLELDEKAKPRLGSTLKIADSAFEGVFNLFAAYTWHLDDTPGGDSDEINPDVLGYIFEKYINQKAFGAYYTRPEITSYLADRSIHALILERIEQPAFPELGLPALHFATVSDMLAKMDARTAIRLVNEVLPSITVLDPAVGSGAFLVAALKSLINVYYAVVGRAKLNASEELAHWLKNIEATHPSVEYYIKRRIVSDNLYGVDIMEEACEIAKLRLFLAMVSSVRRVADLEPLPNIDFNILHGNSLVGLMRVNAHEFDRKQDDLFKPPFRRLLDEKNRKLDVYRHAADMIGKHVDLRAVRDEIDTEMNYAQGVMNELLRDQFEALGVKYEQATWDAAKHKLGKPKKRRIELADIDAQHPLHWGYAFDDVMQRRGGFDIIVANPPWEAFKPFAREFFAQHSKYVTKKKMDDKAFEALKDSLLETGEIRDAWIEYESRFPYMSNYFRSSPDYVKQYAIVGGKRTGSDLDLYKLFMERIFGLLRPEGHVGVVVPAGIYMALGATGLRNMLFGEAQIEGMVGFVNSKEIFEDVHRSYKFVVLTIKKSSLGTSRFPAAFVLNNPAELARFPSENGLWFQVDFIRRLSPESHSMMEFKSEKDLSIVEKLSLFPTLGEKIEATWNLSLGSEFHMTGDKSLFKSAPGRNRLRLYEGKMIWQFDCLYANPTRWVEEKEGRESIIGKREQDAGQELDYQRFRLAFRSTGENTNERNLIATVLPKNVFCGNSLTVSRQFSGTLAELLFVCSMFNSFVLDWLLRLKIQRNLNIFLIYQLPVPRLRSSDKALGGIMQRAAQLICITPEFDELAKAIGDRDHRIGVVDSVKRGRLRAELDGLVAHLYGLTDAEFLHILGTFPLVPEPVKIAAYNAYRDVARGLIQ